MNDFEKYSDKANENNSYQQDNHNNPMPTNFSNSQGINENYNSLVEENSQGEVKKKKGFLKVIKAFALMLLVLICCVVGGAVLGSVGPLAKASITKAFEKEQNNKTEKKEEKAEGKELGKDASPMAVASKANVELIKRVKKSVVCITTTSQTQGLFNMVYEAEGSGSGVIFSKNEKNIYIVTNSHVIDGASEIKISIDSEDLVSAELVGKNANEDLAVISVSFDELRKKGIEDVEIIALGDSDKVEPGSSVIAIGNAMGDGNTATSGIVSYVNKEVNINGKSLNVIQTDAAINPGNSGGALINSKGEVIGINTAKLSTTSVEGVGYSITSNSAKPIIEKLMNREQTPFLGVYVSDISEEMAKAYNLPQTGVIISQIIPNTSAANSDLQETDIITGIDDKPIFTKEQLVEVVNSHKVGDKVELKIIRNGKNMKTVSVKLIASPNDNY